MLDWKYKNKDIKSRKESRTMKVIIASRLKELRTQKGLTQEQIAQICNVSVQAVSKWECELSYPDIQLLPLLAETFCVSLDSLLCGKTDNLPCEKEEKRNAAALFPEEDMLPEDDVLRIVQCRGRKLLGKAEYDPKVQIPLLLPEDSRERPLQVEVWGSASLEGSVGGSLSAGASVCCEDVGGSVGAGTSVNCSSVGGSVAAGTSVDCNTVGGSVMAGGDVDCNTVGGSVTAGADVDCGNVNGDVSAGSDVNCGNVEGSVSAGGDVSCGNVTLSVNAEGDVECGAIAGGVELSGDLNCESIAGDVSVEGDLSCETIEGNASVEGDLNCQEINGESGL